MTIKAVQLHGFCNAEEVVYSGIVYVRALDQKDKIHVSLVMAKTKVKPIKQLSIPHLELCGTVILAKLLHYMAKILDVPISNFFLGQRAVSS